MSGQEGIQVGAKKAVVTIRDQYSKEASWVSGGQTLPLVAQFVEI